MTSKNQMSEAAQNAINGIVIYDAIKKTFNDYAAIQEKTKTWKPNGAFTCMISRSVESSSKNFNVGICRTEDGWEISACVVNGRYVGYYREYINFDFSSDESAFIDAVYDACAKVLTKETIRNEELALAEERAKARIAEMESTDL